ncbi:MAG: transcriptional repressor LexA [Betaproteobacteria bacterium]|jgi:repressor LexA
MNQPLPKLTARQEEILQLVQDSIAENGAPPTRSEIAQRLGFASANAAEEHLKALAKKGYLELSPGTSRGIKIRESLRQTAKQLTLPSQMIAQLTLPLIGRVAAGSPILAMEHVEKQVPVDPSLFSQGADYLLKVKGLSMRDAGILDGDYLAVKKASEARNGDIVVARIDDEVTVKRWLKTKTSKGIQIQLIAENPDFEPIIIENDGRDFSIEGLAVGLIRPNGL